uniref:Uncharacterized protein n=1 Tax=Pipistrellus kuhlii TaxID=59472 RepID=A0A7J7VBP1_PIPKU|nr:hypothetical protein mPipKuh1_008469 [Pipistrellus kuhlii]
MLRFLHGPPWFPQLPGAKSQSLPTPVWFPLCSPFLRHRPSRLTPLTPAQGHCSYLTLMPFSQTSAAHPPPCLRSLLKCHFLPVSFPVHTIHTIVSPAPAVYSLLPSSALFFFMTFSTSSHTMGFVCCLSTL